ncbi:MAG: cytosine permease [Eubacteriales bacterium]|nr:cytosine permease [Eubacteriales bacterium]
MNEKKKKSSSIETTTLEKVPIDERKGWVDVALIQAGIMICVPTLLLGGILAENMSLTNAILSGIVGYIIVIILFSLMGIMGSDLGVPTCITAIGGFGRKGARYLISTLIFISMIGWFAVQTSVCGDAFSNLIDRFFHVNISPILSMIIWGTIMLVTAVYGINALDKLNKIAVPALFLVTIIGCILALNKYGTDKLFVDNNAPTMSFIDGIVLTVSFMAAGCLAAADITRYQRTRKDTILSSSIGVMPAGVLMVVLGAVMTRVAQQYDITLVFCEVGIPILGMLVLISATWTTNTTNAYSGGINAVLMFNLAENKRAIATMVSGVIGTVFAMIGLADHFESFLYILGDALLPTMGVILADYWIVGKGKAENFKIYEGFNWIGIISWITGYGVIKFIPYGIPFAQGIGAAAILYLVLTKLLGRPQDKIQQKVLN